ncbi:hypothetical protein [Parachlamydia sp. AcF125]|uniref:hypothetical protein n=1 Tax=Parachlamydia sp. AcF125 TaxID=2795736 RepID=UPI001BD806E1|nr:hypothetical protein [Parachlamydia sp. AcF125]MBS4168586.1 hypothetical protein [Parachlamydia sp. AcF125]
MRSLKSFYHFLGSIQFAVTLIALAACFMVVGTWIESLTDSHRSAVQFIYHNPFFKILLIAFFVNILVSALRRWPFRWKHTPFLLTHLGLLMIIAGVFVKNIYGVQGSLEIREGSGSHHFFSVENPIVSLEKKGFLEKEIYPLKTSNWGKLELLPPESKIWPDIQIELVSYAPHSAEKIDTWIHQNEGRIAGLRSFPVHTWEGNEGSLPYSCQAKLHHSGSSPWRIYAFRTAHVEKLAKELFLQTAEIAISDTKNDQLLCHMPLREALTESITWKEGNGTVALDFDFSTFTGFNQPCVRMEGFYKQAFKIKTQLIGKQALVNQNDLVLQMGKAPIALDLVCSPSLTFIENEDGDVYLLAFDSNGEVYSQHFKNGALDKIRVYDQGFGGYWATATIPFSNLPNTRKEREAARLHHLAIQLRQTLRPNSTLPPPVQLFADACQKGQQDFVSSLLLFLHEWDKQGGWVMPFSASLPNKLTLLLESLEWKTLSPIDFKACYWLALLSQEMEAKFWAGEDLSFFLKEKGWPYPIPPLTEKQFSAFMADFTQQVYALSADLPPLDSRTLPTPLSAAALLSAYFRLYSLHLSHFQAVQNQELAEICQSYFASQFLEAQLQEILHTSKGYFELVETLPENAQVWLALQNACHSLVPFFFKKGSEDKLTKEEMLQLIALTLPLPICETAYPGEKIQADLATSSPITLECPLSYSYQPLPTLEKLEANMPLLKLNIKRGTEEETHALSFKAYGTYLRQPILGGEYRIGFQAKTEEIPYHLRLKNARQIPYAQSPQAYNYECDLVVMDQKKGTQIETTLSMNCVYETWDGYRFYLANMTPATEISAKKVQVVVNYDPAKSLLTYPGAALLSLGIFLLFWASSSQKKK